MYVFKIDARAIRSFIVGLLMHNPPYDVKVSDLMGKDINSLGSK